MRSHPEINYGALLCQSTFCFGCCWVSIKKNEEHIQLVQYLVASNRIHAFVISIGDEYVMNQDQMQLAYSAEGYWSNFNILSSPVKLKLMNSEIDWIIFNQGIIANASFLFWLQQNTALDKLYINIIVLYWKMMLFSQILPKIWWNYFQEILNNTNATQIKICWSIKYSKDEQCFMREGMNVNL